MEKNIQKVILDNFSMEFKSSEYVTYDMSNWANGTHLLYNKIVVLC